MPNIRLQNTVPNTRNRNDVPNIRVSGVGAAFLTTTSPALTFGGVGYPIGILLTITDRGTHSRSAITQQGSRDAPNIRIANI